jgi:hypothetical protein
MTNTCPECGAAGLFYRCGYCGQPTDKDGRPLDIEVCDLLTDENLNNAELVHGYCCPPQQDNYIIVTRDMAIDAGDLSLEGERWRW